MPRSRRSKWRDTLPPINVEDAIAEGMARVSTGTKIFSGYLNHSAPWSSGKGRDVIDIWYWYQYIDKSMPIYCDILQYFNLYFCAHFSRRMSGETLINKKKWQILQYYVWYIKTFLLFFNINVCQYILILVKMSIYWYWHNLYCNMSIFELLMTSLLEIYWYKRDSYPYYCSEAVLYCMI